MGKRVYLNDAELELLREAVEKWTNWAVDDRTEEEHDALESLRRKRVW
jgi:hypothetical protein